MYRILLVDDDPDIQISNEAFLKKKGYEVYHAESGAGALAIASTTTLDAVVLDLDMPDMDGITICRRLRETSSIPILFLSAYAQTDDRIRGLMAGGDDYLAKPYSLVELELRLRLHISRCYHMEAGEVLKFGKLEIDIGLREVRYGAERGDFTVLEFDLLAFLARNAGQVFSYEQLYDRVWKSPLNESLHNVQVCTARVRQRLERLCPGMHYIETVRGKGYRFRADAVAPAP